MNSSGNRVGTLTVGTGTLFHSGVMFRHFFTTHLEEIIVLRVLEFVRLLILLHLSVNGRRLVIDGTVMVVYIRIIQIREFRSVRLSIQIQPLVLKYNIHIFVSSGIIYIGDYIVFFFNVEV